MSNTGRAAAGKVYTGRGSLVPPSFQDIGTNSGLTNNGVLIANGNSPFAATVAGVTGQVLMGNTGADPSFQNGGTVVGQTITGDDSVILSPTAGNWNILGQDAGTVSVMDTNGSVSTLRIEDRTWTTEFVVDPSSTVGLRGTYTTIQAAVTAASSGDTVFVRAGTYTENIALKAGVNITGLPSDGTRGLFVQSQFTPTVKIIGKMTFSSAGSVDIANVFLQTNGDFLLEVTGVAASNVAIKNSYIYCSNNTGISSTSTSSAINFINCQADLGTTGIAYFALSAGGNLAIDGGRWANSGASVTNSTWSAGILTIQNCEFNSYITSSGAGSLGGNISNVFFNGAGNNITCITHGNTTVGGISVKNSTLPAGTASAISIGASAVLNLYNCNIQTSNTNAITGSGTLNFGQVTFYGTSSTINTTTQVPYIFTNDAMKIVTPGAYPYTTVPQDAVILVDTSAARTITPLASPTTGQKHVIKDSVGTAAGNNITVTPSGKNIDGAASFIMNINYQSITIVYNGTEWNVI